jgi:pyrroloquinoline quinone (PQQ) biosynthesis protein C
MITITPHPEWVQELLEHIKPYQQQILSSKIFEAVGNDLLTKHLAQGAMTAFYPLIESFPQFLALNLAKVPAGNAKLNNDTRDWLITNISQERQHAKWWRTMAHRFGVSPQALGRTTYPPAQIDVINNYLWRICTHGSLPEAIAAANFAVEGATGEWTKMVSAAFKRFPRCEEIPLSGRDLEWISAHADYDDKHPIEALEVVKAYASNDRDRLAVKDSTTRALEYYALALEACYEIYAERYENHSTISASSFAA